MNRDTVRPLIIALLCVLAIGLATATLDSAVVEPSDGGGIGGGDEGLGVSPNDEGERDVLVPLSGERGPLPNGTSAPRACYPVLRTPPAILTLVGAFAVVGFVLYRKAGILAPTAFFGTFGLLTFLLYNYLASCPGLEEESEAGAPGLIGFPNGSLPTGGAGGFGQGTGVAQSPPSLALTLLLGVALVAAVVVLVNATSGDEVVEPPTETGPDRAETSAVARAAGDAADRIEAHADVTNEVYRAWREMTRHLDVERPESSTPAEFASAAVEAGLAREDVDDLTRVFEEVRYGGRDPSGDREERAVAALRRIEAEYAEGGDE